MPQFAAKVKEMRRILTPGKNVLSFQLKAEHIAKVMNQPERMRSILFRIIGYPA